MSKAISTPTAIVLEHKGYQANAQRTLKDNSLQGLVVGMERDLLAFEGADIGELVACSDITFYLSAEKVIST